MRTEIYVFILSAGSEFVLVDAKRINIAASPSRVMSLTTNNMKIPHDFLDKPRRDFLSKAASDESLTVLDLVISLGTWEPHLPKEITKYKTVALLKPVNHLIEMKAT